MKKRLLALFLMAAVMTEVQPVLACTSVIVSGRVTKDGRPLIFKNRDTSTLHNMTIIGQGQVATISWTMVGWPLSTVAIPLVLTSSGKLPAFVANDGTVRSRQNEMRLQVKEKVFSLKSGNTNSYGDLDQIMNKLGAGIMQRVQTLEKEMICQGNEAPDGLRKSKSFKTVEAYYV